MKKHITKIVSYILIFAFTAGHITGCGGSFPTESTSLSELTVNEPESERPSPDTTETAPGTESSLPETETSPETTEEPPGTENSPPEAEPSPGTTEKAPDTENPPPETTAAAETTEKPPGTSDTPVTDVDALLESMTLRQKVGQLFIVAPEALEKAAGKTKYGVTSLSSAASSALERYPVGGVIMFSANIVSPEQITAFNKALQSASYIPMFISVDEEGGKVARLANNSAFGLPKYESPAAVGKTGDSNAALSMGRTIGSYLHKYGFNMDFAPVADVNTNPDNTVIGSRAFSSDAETSARMVSAMAEGLRREGIIPVFKHFPGHGDTAEDSHNGIAVSMKTEGEMESCEWLTFGEATDTDCIMVGHIAAPAITGDLTPASMSYTMVTEILREKLDFNGLIITDSMQMGAITSEYDTAEAAVGAILAGCDIILMPKDLVSAFEAVVAAAENGTISEARLDESVRRILTRKLAL